MNTHNLAIVFGPTLFQTDGKDYKAGRVVEDLINHYVKIFNVGSRPPRLRCCSGERGLDQADVWTFPGDGEVEGGGSWICSVCSYLLASEMRGGASMSLQTLEIPEPGGAGTAGQGNRFPWGPASASAGTRVVWSALMAPWAPLPWQVNDQEMKKQQDEIMAIMKMREAASSGTQVGLGHGDLPGAPSLHGDLTACSSISWRCPRQGVSMLGGGGFSPHMGSCRLKCFPVALQQAGDFICTVYLEEKKTEAEQHVKVSGGVEGAEGTGTPCCMPKPLWWHGGDALSWHEGGTAPGTG